MLFRSGGFGKGDLKGVEVGEIGGESVWVSHVILVAVVEVERGDVARQRIQD